MARPFIILVISGGGFCGLYSTRILELLEAERGGVPLIDTVDMVCGTSAGGLLAIGLSLGQSAEQLSKTFEENGPPVFNAYKNFFKRKFFSSLGALRGLIFSKYSNRRLQALIENVVSENLLKDCRRPTFVTSISYEDASPHIFRSYRNSTIKCSDAALATSAAPTFFRPHGINNKQYVDGGLIANSADMIAVHEAITSFGRDISDIYILSIGTTMANNTGAFLYERFRGWLPRLYRIKSFMAFVGAAQEKLAHEICQLTLKDRFYRIDSVAGEAMSKRIGLDKADMKARLALLALADSEFSRVQQDSSTNECLRLVLNPEIKCPKDWKGKATYT